MEKKKKKLIFLKAYYISYKNCINTFLKGQNLATKLVVV